MTTIDEYVPIVGSSEVESIKQLAERVKGSKVIHVNATTFGGGVAEILRRLIPLANTLGINTSWETLRADLEFFVTTKKIHNALQGDMRINLSKEELDHYFKNNRLNASHLNLDGEVVVIHDPQPLPLIEYRNNGKWVWRCHIDTSTLNPAVWPTICGLVRKYDALVFSLERYVPKDLSDMRTLIHYPTIDPLSPKNCGLSPTEIQQALERYGIDPERPIITTVSRFDPWKNLLGTIDVYRKVRGRVPDAQLILAGSFARDDPEGTDQYEKTVDYAKGDRDIHVLTNIDGVGDKEINSFQRASSVVTQLSTREGFGLTVTEALWKGVPVVGTKVGGITLQVIDGVNGYLVESLEDAAEKATMLLKKPWLARELGVAGTQHVKLNFLITKGIKDYLRMHIELVGK